MSAFQAYVVPIKSWLHRCQRDNCISSVPEIYIESKHPTQRPKPMIGQLVSEKYAEWSQMAVSWEKKEC